MQKDLIDFNLSDIADGLVQRKFSQEVKKVLNNIMDPETPTSQRRSITLTVGYAPNDNLDAINVDVSIKSKLAAKKSIKTKLFVGKNPVNGGIEAAEYSHEVRGQISFDDKGELVTDTGERVKDIERKRDSKILNLNDKKA